MVSPHVLSTQAGMEIIAAGGNAVDAAIAANAVQGVAAPETCGIGGDLFALVWEPGSPKPTALNSSGPAGANANPDELRQQGLDTIPPFHPVAVTIPGCVAGWTELANRHGTRPLGQLLQPAIRLATDGFPASTELSLAFAARAESVPASPSGAEMYPKGAAPTRGEVIRRPLLAATLRRIASEGSSGFYEGPAAEAISRATEARITLEDLAGFRPEWTQPLGLDLFGVTGWTVPPNSQGYLTLATLGIFQLMEPPHDPNDPLWSHLLIEAYRAAVVDRDRVATDPVTAPLSPSELVDWERLRKQATGISPDKAQPHSPLTAPPGGTAYMCAVDGRGVGISLIQSNYMGIGSGIGAGDAGFLLHNRGAGFDLRPGSANELAAGRRPLHTLSPTLWSEGEELRAVLGTRGGNQQPQILAQLAARIFGLGSSPAQAQDAPRWTIDIGRKEPAVEVESRMPASIVTGLEERGHTVEKAGERMGGWGPVSVITIDDRGVRTGAPDPRVNTAMAAAR